MEAEKLVYMIAFMLFVLQFLFLLYRIFSKKRRRHIKLFSGRIFGNIGWLLEALKSNEQQLAKTPRTLSVKEALYLDEIRNDFPELNLDLAKSYVNEIVTDYLNCLETGDTSELERDCTENFVIQAKSRRDNKPYRNIKFHRTVISDYRKNGSEATVVFQTACQYTLGGRQKQTRFEVKYIYYLSETPHNIAALLRCPYCGAPLGQAGDKVCKYCGNGVVDTIKRTWKFSDIREF